VERVKNGKLKLLLAGGELNMSLSHCKILLLPLFLTCCARVAAPDGAMFAHELAGHVAGVPQACFLTNSTQNLHAIDSSTFAYGSGRTIYVNHPGGPCAAISPDNTLIVDAQPGRYCRGDRVRGLETGALIAGPVCVLGDWVPYRMP
jgi:hypothetical protein